MVDELKWLRLSRFKSGYDQTCCFLICWCFFVRTISKCNAIISYKTRTMVLRVKWTHSTKVALQLLNCPPFVIWRSNRAYYTIWCSSINLDFADIIWPVCHWSFSSVCSMHLFPCCCVHPFLSLWGFTQISSYLFVICNCGMQLSTITKHLQYIQF